MILPDRPDTRRVLDRWASASRYVLSHASGRPWLVGDLDPDEVLLATVGSLRVAVIGSSPVTVTRLTELVTGVRTAAGLDSVARALPGCSHLVASIGGVLRVQGSLTGLRSVFHARVDRVPVAGNRADVLARMAGSGFDEEVLAARVACGAKVPPPLVERSPWRGVHALAPDHYLRIEPDGAASEVRWWRPPDPDVPLTAGVGVVRQALEEAVVVRGPAQERLGADLSGGMDSTSLCFLAARAGNLDLLTFRCAESDPTNDDREFAAHAADRMPHAEHVVAPQSEMPDIFADPGDAGDVEAPYRFTRTLARMRHIARLLAANGVRKHLAGHGGDELFHGPPTYLHPLIRRRPLTGLAHTRGHRALYRWSWAATVSGLAGGGDVGAWWHRQAQQLTAVPPPRRTPPLGWGYPLRARAWVTPAAADTARAVLCCVGESAQPLAGDRGQHATLAILRMMGPAYRQLAGVYAAAGLRLELPYLDDRVVEAALAIRQHERTTPWRYKPVLVEAMRGVLPDAVAGRSTKGEFGKDVRIGLRRHLPAILDLFADSALAAHGLIDADLLRRALLAPQVDNSAVMAMEDLLGCENWLRTVTASPRRRRHDVPAAAG